MLVERVDCVVCQVGKLKNYENGSLMVASACSKVGAKVGQKLVLVFIAE